MSDEGQISEDQAIEFIRAKLAEATPSKRRQVIERFFLAALGSIPWVGGFISAAASMRLGADVLEADNLQTRWLEEHAGKLERLHATLNEIGDRFESLGEQIDQRIESEPYLDLVRRSFRAWDRADTEEKRKYVANVITNASGTVLCSDDVVRLFIDWIDLYHEAHFAVIREVYRSPGCTRYEIWHAIHGEFPRDDSAEADLFRLLIHDLSTGRVLRQHRDTTADGQFLKKRRSSGKRSSNPTMETAFEDTKPYVLTELGKQFVHYTMNEVVPRVSERSS